MASQVSRLREKTTLITIIPYIVYLVAGVIVAGVSFRANLKLFLIIFITNLRII